MSRLLGVPANSTRLEKYWPEVERLWPRLRATEMRLEAARIFIDEQALQLWVYLDDDESVRAFLMTEILHHPSFSVLQLKYLAGKLRWSDLPLTRAIVFPWAKTYGCTKVEIVGRRGWVRILGLTEVRVLARGDI